MHSQQEASSSQNSPRDSEIARLFSELEPMPAARSFTLTEGAADGGGELFSEGRMIEIQAQLDAKVTPAVQPGSQPVAVVETGLGKELTVEELLRAAGLERVKALEELAEAGSKSAEQAFQFFQCRYGPSLPPKLTFAQFLPLYRELLGELSAAGQEWQLPEPAVLTAMQPLERDYTAYRMKKQGYSNNQIAAAFGKSSGNTAKEWHRSHAARFGLPLLS